MGVTIQDIAADAGVSVSTVSRVINGKDDVAAELESAVRDAIRKLGYTPNRAARSIRRPSSREARRRPSPWRCARGTRRI